MTYVVLKVYIAYDLRGIGFYSSSTIMTSRSKRMLLMCQIDENRPNKIAKENTIGPDNDSHEKENQIADFNIMDLPMDIIDDVNDSFLKAMDPANCADNEVEHAVYNLQETVATEINVPEAESENDDVGQDRDFHISEEENLESESATSLTSESFNLQDQGPPKRKRELGRNTKKINQDLRMKGKAYLGYRRPPNQSKTFQDVEREERKLGIPCISNFCRKTKKRRCNEIDDLKREEVFKKFWQDLSWGQRQTYVCNLVNKVPPQQRRSEGENVRKTGTLKYSLKIDDAIYPVCKKMFLSTLGLREWQVCNWVKQSKHGINDEKNERPRVGGILSERAPKNKFMKSFLENLNKLPSHYCRKDTNKLYLEQSFFSIVDLYTVYKESCRENNEVAMSQNSLTKMMKRMNISLYQPKKDKCDICCQYEEKNLSVEEWEKHCEEKERAREEKAKDKEQGILGRHHVITMDLQAVKVCPSLNASSVYFKTKLCVHNFTVYNIVTRHCTCYWFDETQADLQSSTFVSFIFDYIKRFLNDGKPIIIYSDGCTYQNRNNIMSNALLRLSEELNVTIEQKFLVKGHTQMECDSVHANIERKLKNRKIFLPSDYLRVCEESRTSTEKYEAKLVNHKFFRNFNKNLVYSSIRPGRKPGDPTVTNLRALKYSQTIFFKLNFDSEYEELPQRTRKTISSTNNEYEQLHNQRIKIKKKQI